MSSEEASCSDCKLELIQARWTQLLLNWKVLQRNNCINAKKKTDRIDMNTVAQIIKKYKDEISIDATDKALLSSDNIELFIKCKFPIARLEILSNEMDKTKKIYIITSILLFYCCVSSQSGKVDADICAHLDVEEQKMILKFCEELSKCEVTIDNVENAIKEACAISKYLKQMRNTLRNVKDVLPELVNVMMSNDSMNSTNFTQVKKINNVDQIIACNSKHIAADDELKCKKGSLEDSGDQKRRCQPECACTRCSVTGPCCGDLDSPMIHCVQKPKKRVRLKDFKDLSNNKRLTYLSNWKLYLTLIIGILLAIILITTILMIPKKRRDEIFKTKRSAQTVAFYQDWAWQCKDHLCQKVFHPLSDTNFYNSLSRCTLLCMGPQLWPYPIGFTYFSKTIVALATSKLEYKFQIIPSDNVHQYLAEAFNHFIKDLVALEKVHTQPRNLPAELKLMKMNIQIEIDNDTDPRLRTTTNEMYSLKIESQINDLLIRISAPSFCGVRHGLETLSQLILLDESSGYLITVSSAEIKDSPSYKYRGLMIDTGRNFIPVPDLLRTLQGMAKCKLNTFHWRISDATSFPLQLSEIPDLLEYGPYDRSLVYTKEDIKTVVDWAGFRCIRVLIEVAMPSPVGRPWSWSPQANCLRKSDKYTCDNILCLKLEMKDSLFDLLQIIYSEIIDLTKVDDIFHLSDGIFSISKCFRLLEDREGFLDKALESLKRANGGFLPKLPIIWYTGHLNREYEAKAWERFGVQLNDWNPDSSLDSLSKFKVIHSSKYDLSCQMKKKRCTKYRTWQDMYSWKNWRNVEAFTTEGGEALLWTDLVDSGNIDYHVWPRAAAVAERLWSDIVINSSATRSVYIRLDAQRWRMLFHGVEVQPIWPARCSFNPSACLNKI